MAHTERLRKGATPTDQPRRPSAPNLSVPRTATQLCVVALLLSAATPARPAAADAGLAARILIDDAGVYAVAFDDLRAAGLPLSELPDDQVGITHGDEAVPSLLEDGGDGRFGPGDRVLFLAEAATSVYAPHNVYWFRTGAGARARVSEGQAAPFGTPQARFTATVRVEPETFYLPTLPREPDSDHWFAARASDGRPARLTVDLPGLDPTAQGGATIRVGLQGFSTLPPDPDHHTLIKLGAQTLAEATWDGDVAHVIEAKVGAKLLRPAGNEFTIEASKPDGVQFDVVLVDWIEVSYPRTFDAPGGFLSFPAIAAGGSYRVTGLPEKPEVVWRADGPGAIGALPFRDTTAHGKHAAEFADGAAPTGAVYVVAAPEGVREPVAIEPDQPSALRDERNRADYLVVAHASLIGALQPLIEYRRKQGLSVLVADVQDVYDEFDGGLAEPVAIKRFVDFAYHHFQPPAPRFLLLVGDASYDYKGHGKGTLPNLVPTYLVHTDPFGETGSDNWFACVEADDLAPDLAVGRIPARRPETVEDIVTKTIALETSPPPGDWAHHALLVADNGIRPNEFEPEHQEMCDEASRFLEQHGWTTEKLYIAKGSENAKDVSDGLVRGVDAGCKLVVYAGHAIFDRWAHEEILTLEKVAAFRNGGKTPFVISLSCLDGMFYHANKERCLAEEWISIADGGAVAYWSPTGMGYPAAHEIMLREFLKAAFSSGTKTLGEAVRLAKANMLRERSDHTAADSAVMFTYFGDPALSAEAFRGQGR
jgi:hypothetical protein